VSGGEVVLITRSRVREGHEYATRAALAERIARLIGYAFAGEYDASERAPTPRYFVPEDTLDTGEAAALGIASEAQLFGGFAPHRFMATKAITHPLVGAHARHPYGWPHDLGRELAGISLHGYAAFAAEDARIAAERILERSGSARVKLADASGGGGQFTVCDLGEADALLSRIGPAIERAGAVVEEDLAGATTYSVGTVDLRGARISYCGTQRTTIARSGDRVYAGSDLFVVRGGFDRLAERDFDARAAIAIDRALNYDRLVTGATGVRASRRNYDVLHGFDRDGRERVGVLEQSWRLGGGTGAELAAFEAFARDPDLAAVRASTFESHTNEPPPHGATVYFRDENAERGPFSKYSLIERDEGHGHSR
jgi:hypothetical protein